MSNAAAALAMTTRVSILTVIVLFAASAPHGQILGQSQNSGAPAALQGTVRDSRGRPIVGATVDLEEKGSQSLSTHTNSEGEYRFFSLHEGTYTLRAEMDGYGPTSVGPFVFEAKQGTQEGKRVDLALDPLKTPSTNSVLPGTSASVTPSFYDEPQFTVAGVTDAANPGGHGSNVALRTTETLTKEAASLGAGDKALASNLPTNERSTGAEASLRSVAAREPGNFEANRQLGNLLLDEGKDAEAVLYLERAARLNSGDYQNARNLALAYAGVGKYESARTQIRDLLARPGIAHPRGDMAYISTGDTAALHHLLAEVDEKLGDPLGAAHEYQQAVELEPSESNLFDWGAELLMHRAFEPAIEVFTKGNRLFPGSVRMLSGLGVSWYARGSYDQAFQHLCEASDLNPTDPQPYLFLGKMQNVETVQPQSVVDRLARFAQLQPDNALANYYYAVSLWRRREGSANQAQMKSLLTKAVQLDPHFGAAYLHLAILYADRGDLSAAISAYQKAIEVSPELDEAHYRLAQAYERSGEKLKAQEQLELYQQISKRKEADVELERKEIREFVYTLGGQGTVTAPK